MNRLLNNMICLNCTHEEKWHNLSPAGDYIICHGWMQLTYEHPNYGAICSCTNFKMDNLKYLENFV
jgi:hypothetical protein